MASTKRTVLITGCSDGGMGAELAKEFHKAGLKVYATARDVSKMAELTPLGIETIPLDVQSDSSIKECAAKIPSLDILINNAGASYTMPVVDIDLTEAKKLFDINVWGVLAVTQAFIPHLRRSKKAIIATNTSVAAGMTLPWQATYNASKAAMSSYLSTLRMELQPFGISVVELRTGGVQTRFLQNLQAKQPQLPEETIYAPARKEINSALRGEWVEQRGFKCTANEWAKGVVRDLLGGRPPEVVWRGDQAYLAGWLEGVPRSWLAGFVRKLTGFNRIEEILRGRLS